MADTKVIESLLRDISEETKNTVTQLKSDISNAYTSISEKGGTLPEEQNAGNLAEAIESIPSGGLPTDGSTFVSGFEGSFCTPLLQDKIVDLVDNTTTSLPKTRSFHELHSLLSLQLNACTSMSASAVIAFCPYLKVIKMPACTSITSYDRRYGAIEREVQRLEYVEFGKMIFTPVNGYPPCIFGTLGIDSTLRRQYLKCLKLAQGWDFSNSNTLNLGVWDATYVTSAEDISELNYNLVNYFVNTYGGNGATIQLNTNLVSKLTQDTLDAFAAKNLTIAAVS